MSRILIASKNQGKLREFEALLKELNLELWTPAQLDIDLRVREDGQTYAENAALKGEIFARASGMITLADDSGLEVYTLGGLPGLHSARFSPEAGATDADRRTYLLQCLSGKPRPWLACFHCVLALVTPGGESRFAEGVCQGEVIPDERGEHGFGYDPIFLLPGLGMTMAELSMEEKNILSHRARAVRAILPVLNELIRELT